jgi:hypothetical protein
MAECVEEIVNRERVFVTPSERAIDVCGYLQALNCTLTGRADGHSAMNSPRLNRL